MVTPQHTMDRELFTCPACGSSRTREHVCEARDYLTEIPFDVKICSECGCGLTAPVPEDMEPFYPRQYRRYVPAVALMLSLLYRWRVGRWCRGKAAGRVLEIGCGDGVMLEAFSRRGWNVSGTERTEAMAATARDKYGIRVYVPPSKPIPGQDSYDLIVLFQVLEHLCDPVETLRDARQLLANGGRIIVGVPNLSSWQAKCGRDGWLHLDVPRHLVHFTPASITQVARRAGLRLERICFVSPEHDPYGWVQTFLNRWAGNNNGLTKRLMGIVPWRCGDIPLLLASILLCPLAMVLALISWACGAGAIMEASLVSADS